MNDPALKPEWLQRRHPAHHPPIERFNAPTVLFCTACIHDRSALLDNAAAMQALRQAWQAAMQWHVGEYLCMPDHLHFFCVPGVPHPENVQRWSRYWKRLASELHPALKGQWQPDVWDTQMRDSIHYEEKLSYVRQNPVRKGLVARWEDWPFRGVTHVIRW